MAKYLTKFATTAAFEAAESTLAKPHVSLTKDNMQVHYIPSPTPPSETLFYKSMEGITGLFVVNADGLAIYNSQGMGFYYSDGVISLGGIGSAPIPKKQYDFTFNTSAETQDITIDGVTYTFMKSGSYNYTISPSINEFPS